MWAYVVRRLLYYFPLYLCILLAIMLLLRVNESNAISQRLGKNASQQQIDELKEQYGFNKPLYVQYWDYVTDVFTLSFTSKSWEESRPVGEMIESAIPPTLWITVPSIVFTAIISVVIGVVCSFNRGRWLDRSLMFAAVLGMSVSYLVYIIIGQYFGASVLSEDMKILPFEIEGYLSPIWRITSDTGVPVGHWWEPSAWGVDLWRWVRFVSLPVLIGVVVAMGYDTRFYRAVMVEESTRDHIVTARAKGVPESRIMGIHMLKNAMIPIITRITITLPFALTGSILVERFFNIPGMGQMLLNGITAYDFPVVRAVVAILAAAVILTVILTDVAYALVDPRVRLR